jgi:hypothetical protein
MIRGGSLQRTLVCKHTPHVYVINDTTNAFRRMSIVADIVVRAAGVSIACAICPALSPIVVSRARTRLYRGFRDTAA